MTDPNKDKKFIGSPTRSELIKRILNTDHPIQFTMNPIQLTMDELKKVQPAMPDIDPNDIQLITDVKDDLTSDGYALFDPEKLTFTCVVPPYVNIVNVDMKSVLAYYANGTTHFKTFHSYPDIFSIYIDEKKKPSCSWYSPSLKDMNEEKAEQVSNYPYDRPRKDGGCFNPEITGSKGDFGICIMTRRGMSFNQCPSYGASDWETISTAYGEDGTAKVAIQRKFLSHRVPQYQLVDLLTNEIQISPTDDIQNVLKTFEELTDGLDIISPATEKTSYFKTVLTAL